MATGAKTQMSRYERSSIGPAQQMRASIRFASRYALLHRATSGTCKYRRSPIARTKMAPLNETDLIDRLLSHRRQDDGQGHGGVARAGRELFLARALRGRDRSAAPRAGRPSARRRRCPSRAPTSRATTVGAPLLVVRGTDGVVRGFRNSCAPRHEAGGGRGRKRAFACLPIMAGPTGSTARCAISRARTAFRVSTRTRTGWCRWRRCRRRTASCSWNAGCAAGSRMARWTSCPRC